MQKSAACEERKRVGEIIFLFRYLLVPYLLSAREAGGGCKKLQRAKEERSLSMSILARLLSSREVQNER